MKFLLMFSRLAWRIIPMFVLGAGLWGREAQAARGRPQLNGAGTTFVADNGNLLRGPILGSNLSQGASVTNYGFNALHMYAESAGGGYAAGSQSNQVDAAVAMTRTNGLYLIITLGGGGASNTNFIYDFWNFYAGRYANETHVIYEIQNEVTHSAPSSAVIINVETNAYNIIRSKAPNTPVLFFSYVAMENGSAALQDINALGPGIDWTKAAIAFHGYGSGGAKTIQASLKTIIGAGYPCFQTEFYRWPWGTGNFPLGANESMYQDTTETGLYERMGVSWLSFMVYSAWTNDVRYRGPITNGGVLWTPDYGSWPAGSRSTYGNGGDPWFTTNLSSTIRIQAENYDAGGQGIAYNDTTSGNTGGAYRSDDVDIESTSDTGGGYDVGWIVAGEWLEYTTWIYEAGYYDIKLRVASAQPTSQLDISFYGTNVSTVTFPGTGGYQTWRTVTNTVFLTPGQQILRLTALTSTFNLNWIELSATPAATGGPLADGTYKIINAKSGLAMEVAGAATTNGAPLDQYTYVSGNHQNWNFTHLGGSQYLLKNVLSGKAIDEASYTALSGDYIQQYTVSGSVGALNQRWIFIPTDSSHYKILNANSGLALEITSAATTNQAIVDQSEYTGDLSQQWLVAAPNATVPPPAPFGLNAMAYSYNAIGLSWPASLGATGYNVKRADTSGGPYTVIATNWVTTNYTDAGLSGITTYFYVVSATNADGESPDSVEANATTQPTGTVIVDDTDPVHVAITGDWTSSTSVAGYYGIDYLHDGNTGSTGGKSVRFSPELPATASYQVYMNWTTGATRANNAPVDVNYAGGSTPLSVNQRIGGVWQLLGTFNFNAGTTGNVLIRNDGANGYVIADAVKFVQLPPPQPNGLMATPGDGQVVLNWGDVTGATSYNVKRMMVNGGAYTNIASPVTAGYTDTTVANGTNYSYVVSAVNVAVEGADSLPASAIPTSLSSVPLTTTINGSELILSWPSDHTGWHLQSQTNPLVSGLGTNWVDVANTTTGNSSTNQLNRLDAAVFYRLKYP
jgi:hypothetical protein